MMAPATATAVRVWLLALGLLLAKLAAGCSGSPAHGGAARAQPVACRPPPPRPLSLVGLRDPVLGLRDVQLLAYVLDLEAYADERYLACREERI